MHNSNDKTFLDSKRRQIKSHETNYCQGGQEKEEITNQKTPFLSGDLTKHPGTQNGTTKNCKTKSEECSNHKIFIQEEDKVNKAIISGDSCHEKTFSKMTKKSLENDEQKQSAGDVAPPTETSLGEPQSCAFIHKSCTEHLDLPANELAEETREEKMTCGDQEPENNCSPQKPFKSSHNLSSLSSLNSSKNENLCYPSLIKGVCSEKSSSECTDDNTEANSEVHLQIKRVQSLEAGFSRLTLHKKRHSTFNLRKSRSFSLLHIGDELSIANVNANNSAFNNETAASHQSVVKAKAKQLTDDNSERKTRSVKFRNVTMTRLSDKKVEITLDDRKTEKSSDDMLDDILLNLSRGEKHLNENERLQLFCQLSPRHRRQLVLQSLRSYLCKLCLMFILFSFLLALLFGYWFSAAFDLTSTDPTTSFQLTTSPTTKQVAFRQAPMAPINGTLHVIHHPNIDEDMQKYAIQWRSSTESIVWAQEFLSPSLARIFENAGLPVSGILITKLSLYTDPNVNILGRIRIKKPVAIEYVVYPEASRNGLVALDDLVRKVRNSLKYQRNWLVDPKFFSLSLGSITSRAVTLQSFLSKDLPPFDAETNDGYSSWQIQTNTTCPNLLIHDYVQVYPLNCRQNDVSPVNQTCRLYCEEDYSLVGDEFTVCLPNGMWSGRQAKCTKFCPVLPAINNGRITPHECTVADGRATSVSFTRCVHYCNKGFRLYGSLHRRCQDNGQWEYDEPACKIQCPMLTPPRNGKMTPSRCSTEISVEGDICTFSCSAMFTIQGERVTTCDSNGRWTHEIPGCRKICRPLADVPNSDVFPPLCRQSVIFEGMSCSYMCHKGFELLGSSIRSCMVNEIWTGEAPQCVRTCSPLQKPSHGRISPSSCATHPQYALNQCDFQCDNGFELDGKTNLTCGENGFWNDVLPTCLVRCPTLEIPDNGDLQCSGNRRNATCVLHCSETYQLRGSGFVTCRNDGIWSEPIGVCQETCPTLVSPRHGAVFPKVCSMIESSVNATCSVSCDRSYSISGPVTTTCLNTRIWSGGQSQCVYERHYMLTIEVNEVEVCLTAEKAESPAPEKRDFNLCMGRTFEFWSVNANGLVKNAGNGKCIGFNPPSYLAKLVFLTCNESDSRQVWQFSSHSTTLKMRYFPYNIWYGYSSAPEVLATEQRNTLTNWLLYNSDSMTKSSFFGALNNGQCPTLQRYPNGLWYPNTCWTQPSAHGVSCSFVCAPGFGTANRSSVVICRSGIWIGNDNISCFQSCPGFNQFSFENGSVTPSVCLSNNYIERGFTCTFSCDNNFVLFGEQNVACLTNGIWSAALPRCHTLCPPLSAPSNGIVLATELCKNPLAMQMSESICQVTCNAGYVLNGTQDSICMENGSWNDTTAHCVRGCPEPETPVNGMVVCNETKIFYPATTTCFYNCSLDTTLHPDIQNTTCLNSGTWSNHPPTCQYFCSTFPPLTNGQTQPSDCTVPNSTLPNGFKCSFFCDLNFSLQGEKESVCLESGLWSDDLPACQPDVHFQLVEEAGSLPITCLLANEYPFHNGYEVRVEPYSQCNSSDLFHIWSIKSHDRIQNVGTGLCLSVSVSNDGATPLLMDCDSSHEMAQRWVSSLTETVTSIRLRLTDLYLQQHNDHAFLSINFIDIRNLSWTAIDLFGNRGTLFGMQLGSAATCPKLTLPSGTNVDPLSCQVLVAVGSLCNISCDPGYELQAEGNATSLSCGNFGIWSTTDIYCKRRQCSPLPTLLPNTLISNSLCTTSSFSAFSSISCTYSCSQGFYLNLSSGNSGNLFCLGSGQWSEPIPKCVPFCRELQMPLNGSISPLMTCTTLHSATSGLMCIFSCQTHFELYGSKYLQCKVGNWNGSEPRCIMLSGSGRCGGFSSVNNAHLNPAICYNSIVPYNTSCRITCDPSYTAVEENNAVCQANSKWSSPLPSCKKVCSLFPAPQNGRLEPQACGNGTITEGHTCSIVCHKGYTLTSNSQRRCLSNGYWDIPRASCRTKTQFMLQISNSCLYVSMENSSLVYLDMCSYNNLSQWWEWIDTRRIRNVLTGLCLIPSVLQSYVRVVLVDCNQVRHNWECPYSSNMNEGLIYNEKFRLAAAVTTPPFVSFVVDLEEDDPQWVSLRTTELLAISNDNITARPCLFRPTSKCPRLPPTIENGFLEEHCLNDGVNVIVGTTCRYFCNDGYILIGEAEKQCQANGEWLNATQVQCKISCPALSDVEFSSANPAECTIEAMPESSACSFSCESGYLLVGSSIRFCKPDGTWSGYSTICHQQCPAMQISSDITIFPSSCATTRQYMGTVCRANCPYGFSLVGSAISTCQFFGSWTGTITGCERSCESLPTLWNGIILPKDCIGTNKYAGNVCVYSCDPLHSIRGNRMRTCTQDGLWSGFPPECLRRCQVLNAPSRGNILCDQNQSLVGDTCTFTCNPGYVIEGSNKTRTCLETGQWSGTELVCKNEDQFVIAQGSPNNDENCLFVTLQNHVTSFSNSSCNFFNSSARWAWHNSNQIRHSSTRLCLSSNILSIRSHLVLKECNASDLNQNWECSNTNKNWFIRLSHSKLYPLYSPISTENVLIFSSEALQFILNGSFAVHKHTQWYAKSLSSNRTSICSTRKADYCNHFFKFSYVDLTPNVCLSFLVPVGTICYFSCAQNFILENKINQTECLPSGQWSRKSPRCLPACVPFPFLFESGINISPPSCSGTQRLVETFVCTFSCPPDRILVGNSVLTCQNNSKWNYQMPRCIATCFALNPLQHGQIFPESCTDFRTRLGEGTRCAYKCLQSEHVLNGASVLTCTANGSWDQPEGKCVKPCSILSSPGDGGTVSPPRCSFVSSVAGDVCILKCDANRTVGGPLFATCLPNGTWTGEQYVCQSMCSIPQPPDYAVIQPSNCLVEPSFPGDACMLTCFSGYEASGNKVIECLENGTWSKQFGKCIRRCSKLFKPSNGEIEPKSCLGGNIYYGHQCAFSCENGYVLEGSIVRSCLSDGMWSGTETKCVIACVSIGPGLNLNYVPSNCRDHMQVRGSMCRASCASGMQSRNGLSSSLSHCNNFGNWNEKSIRACYPICSKPNVANGEVQCFEETNKPTYVYTISTMCKVTCNIDFIATSISESKCELSPGNSRLPRWNPPLSSCQHEPDPMIIISRVRYDVVCLGVEHKQVVLVEWLQCNNRSRKTNWVWHSQYQIQNTATGYCLDVSYVLPNSYVTTSECNAQNAYQRWTCSNEDPYFIRLLNASIFIDTSSRQIRGVMLTEEKLKYNKLYTYNPQSKSYIGTLCSRRSLYSRADICVLPKLPFPAVFQEIDCFPINGLKPGSICTVICNADFRDRITCMTDGLWNPPAELLCRNPCQPYASLSQNAEFLESVCSANAVPYGTFCTLSCRGGFVLIGNTNGTKCNHGGLWEAMDSYSCVRGCSKIQPVLKGKLIPTNCVTGICRVVCLPGYRVNGPRSRTCLRNGRWSGSSFSCSVDPQFSIVSSLKYKLHSLCVEADRLSVAVKAECAESRKLQRWRWNSHFTIENVVTKQCLAVDISRTGSLLTSRRVSDIENGTFVNSDADNIIPIRLVNNGQRVVMTKICDATDFTQRWNCGDDKDLYLHLFSLTIFLDAGALFRPNLYVSNSTDAKGIKWLGRYHGIERSVCSYRNTGTCLPLNDIANGEIQPRVCKSKFVIQGTRCSYLCKSNYVLTGNPVTICLKKGRWSTKPPLCLGKNICPKLPSNERLLINPLKCTTSLVGEGQVCGMTCSSNTLLHGNTLLTCSSDGTWSDIIPSCNVVCPAIRPLDVGFILPQQCEIGNLPRDFVCFSQCMFNTTLLGPTNRTCLSHGFWERQETMCEQYCPPLQNLPNGRIIPLNCTNSSSFSGEACEMQCNSGFSLSGKNRITCIEGSWLGRMASCNQDHCNRIIANRHTRKIVYRGLVNTAVVPTSVVSITCNPGYQTVVPHRRVCLSNQKWSSGSETCQEIKCPALTALYNGEISPRNCIEEKNGISVGTTCYFSCSVGYSLKGTTSKECLLGGMWSYPDLMIACVDTQPKLYATTFNIQRLQELSFGETQLRCLEASKTGTELFYTECDGSNFYQRWKWLGSSRLQSVGKQTCVHLLTNVRDVGGFENSEYFFRLGNCSSHDTSQVRCGNIQSEAGRYQLIVGDTILSSQIVDKGRTVHMVSWSGEWVDYARSTTYVMTPQRSDVRIPICFFMCGGNIRANTGDISSPNYPNEYNRNVNCVWEIQTKNSARELILDFSFLSFQNHNHNLFGKGECPRDYIEVIEEENEGRNLLARLCTNTKPMRFTTVHNRFRIIFYSDNTKFDESGRGWSARWWTRPWPTVNSNCGQLGGNRPVTTSSGVEPSGAPWQVLVVYHERDFCNGAIYNSHFVIIAASCIENFHNFIVRADDQQVLVVYGFTSQTDLLRRLQNQTFNAVRRIWLHPNYSRSNLDNDIALVMTWEEIMFQSSVQPICFPSLKQSRIVVLGFTRCWVVQWSKNVFTHKHSFWDYSHYSYVVLLNKEICDEILHRHKNLKQRENLLCVREASYFGHVSSFPPRPIEAMHDENEGNLLQCKWNQNWYIIGISSFSFNDDYDKPVYVFTKTRIYEEWIVNVTMNSFYLLRDEYFNSFN